MNDLEPVRKEYRQWAELNLMAQGKLPEHKAEKDVIKSNDQGEDKEEKQKYFIRDD